MASERSQSKSRTKSADNGAAGDPDELPSFEEALEALETLVADMEGDELPLEKMIVGYQEGVRLRGICEQRLEEAQAKVELIRDRGSNDGSAVQLEDFDGTGAASGGNPAGPRRSLGESSSATGGNDAELF
jgi:exodeoxyribonuclease VII small subunit